MRGMSRYKETMFILEQLMNEWPMRFEPGDAGLDDPKKNEKLALEIEKTGKLLDTFNHSIAGEIKIYLIIDGEEYNIYLILKSKPFIAGQYSYIKHDKGIENKFIWNFSWFQGLIREFFDKFIIPREPLIFSDQAQSNRGFKFWKTIFEEYVIKKKSHKMLVVNMGKKVKYDIDTVEDMDKYYDKKNSANFQFVLMKL
jgi:hypothetical protein